MDDFGIALNLVGGLVAMSVTEGLKRLFPNLIPSVTVLAALAFSFLIALLMANWVYQVEITRGALFSLTLQIQAISSIFNELGLKPIQKKMQNGNGGQ